MLRLCVRGRLRACDPSDSGGAVISRCSRPLACTRCPSARGEPLAERWPVVGCFSTRPPRPALARPTCHPELNARKNIQTAASQALNRRRRLTHTAQSCSCRVFESRVQPSTTYRYVSASPAALVSFLPAPSTAFRPSAPRPLFIKAHCQYFRTLSGIQSALRRDAFRPAAPSISPSRPLLSCLHQPQPTRVALTSSSSA